MKLLAAPAALVLSILHLSAAEPVKLPQKVASHAETLNKSVRSPVAASLTYANWNYYTNVTIPANGYQYLDSNLDFSASNTMSVSLQSASTDVASLMIAPFWSASGVPGYIPNVSVFGSDFTFSDAGGANFQVAGAQLRLFLYNRSGSAITLKTVFIYTNSQ